MVNAKSKQVEKLSPYTNKSINEGLAPLVNVPGSTLNFIDQMEKLRGSKSWQSFEAIFRVQSKVAMSYHLCVCLLKIV